MLKLPNNDDDGDDGDDDDDDDDYNDDVMMIMIMMRMTMTMTMIVVMSCGNSTSYVLTESPSTSQKAFCHCLYFSFQLQEISSSGPVCYPQRTYYFRYAGRLACFTFELPVLHSQNELTNISPLANKLSSGIFSPPLLTNILER